MAEVPFLIVPCPSCRVKNRVKKYDAGRLPVCAKCRAPLLTIEEHEAQAKYDQSLKDFMNLPDLGTHPGEDK